MTKVLDIIWLIIMMVGICANNFVFKAMTAGEYYISLILWYYVARILSDYWERRFYVTTLYICN